MVTRDAPERDRDNRRCAHQQHPAPRSQHEHERDREDDAVRSDQRRSGDEHRSGKVVPFVHENERPHRDGEPDRRRVHHREHECAREQRQRPHGQTSRAGVRVPLGDAPDTGQRDQEDQLVQHDNGAAVGERDLAYPVDQAREAGKERPAGLHSFDGLGAVAEPRDGEVPLAVPFREAGRADAVVADRCRTDDERHRVDAGHEPRDDDLAPGEERQALRRARRVRRGSGGSVHRGDEARRGPQLASE